jgi:hypothetical protein
MGDISHISDRSVRSLQQTCLAGLALFALLTAIPENAASADEPHPDRSVSTSPQEPRALGSQDVQPVNDKSLDGPPLTRAANQRQIDEMSPTNWLSRFGRVSIGRLE